MHVIIGGTTPIHPIHREQFVLRLWFDGDEDVELKFNTEEEATRTHKLLGLVVNSFILNNNNHVEAIFRDSEFYDILGRFWPFYTTSFNRQKLEAWQWLWYDDAGVAHEVFFGVT